MQAAVPLVGDVKVILRQILDLGVEAPDCAEVFRSMPACFTAASSFMAIWKEPSPQMATVCRPGRATFTPTPAGRA